MARSITFLSLVRLVVCIAALALALVGNMRAASAEPSAVDDGCSGGGTSEPDATGMMIEEVGLVPTNGGPGSFTMVESPVLPEWAMTDNERSIQLIEGTFASGGHLAGWDDIAAAEAVTDGDASEMLRGDLSPVFAVEVAGADVQAARELERPEWAMTDNERSIAMGEGKLTDGGHLAGWDDIAAAETADVASSGNGGRSVVQAS